jgi:hypothetical protein
MIFFFTMLADDGNREQAVELLRRHLVEDARLELEPQPRHRDEERRPRALQVLHEGVERLGEEDLEADAEVPVSTSVRSKTCESGRYESMRSSVVTLSCSMKPRESAHGAEGVHHALGHAGGARGVDDGGEVDLAGEGVERVEQCLFRIHGERSMR